MDGLNPLANKFVPKHGGNNPVLRAGGEEGCPPPPLPADDSKTKQEGAKTGGPSGPLKRARAEEPVAGASQSGVAGDRRLTAEEKEARTIEMAMIWTGVRLDEERRKKLKSVNLSQATCKAAEEKAKQEAQMAHAKEGLPSGWSIVVSRTTGNIYYNNDVTNESQYERPTESALPPALPTIDYRDLSQASRFKSTISESDPNGLRPLVDVNKACAPPEPQEKERDQQEIERRMKRALYDVHLKPRKNIKHAGFVIQPKTTASPAKKHGRDYEKMITDNLLFEPLLFEGTLLTKRDELARIIRGFPAGPGSTDSYFNWRSIYNLVEEPGEVHVQQNPGMNLRFDAHFGNNDDGGRVTDTTAQRSIRIFMIHVKHSGKLVYEIAAIGKHTRRDSVNHKLSIKQKIHTSNYRYDIMYNSVKDKEFVGRLGAMVCPTWILKDKHENWVRANQLSFYELFKINPFQKKSVPKYIKEFFDAEIKARRK